MESKIKWSRRKRQHHEIHLEKEGEIVCDENFERGRD